MSSDVPWRSLGKLPFPEGQRFHFKVKGHGQQLRLSNMKSSSESAHYEAIVFEEDSRHSANVGKQKYSCTFCGRKFQTRSGVRKHMSRHTGKYLYKCKICDKGYNEILDYETHMNRHKGIGFTCMKCNKSLLTMALLLKHQEKCCDREQQTEASSRPLTAHSGQKFPFSSQKPVFPGFDVPSS